MKHLFLSMIFGCSVALGGQSIDWHTIDGGGGVSSNGQFVVSGTIGQPDSSHSQGGNFAVSGGFWSLIVRVQNTNAPLLSIGWTRGRDSAIISWPALSPGFFLEETDNLIDSITEWHPSSAPVATNSEFKFVVVPANSGNRSFRLKKNN